MARVCCSVVSFSSTQSFADTGDIFVCQPLSYKHRNFICVLEDSRTLSGHLSSFMVKCARWSDGRGLYYLFACIFSYLYLFFIYLFFSLKKEGSRKGSRRGSKKGSKRGVQKGGSTFCLYTLK